MSLSAVLLYLFLGGVLTNLCLVNLSFMKRMSIICNFVRKKVNSGSVKANVDSPKSDTLVNCIVINNFSNTNLDFIIHHTNEKRSLSIVNGSMNLIITESNGSRAEQRSDIFRWQDGSVTQNNFSIKQHGKYVTITDSRSFFKTIQISNDCTTLLFNKSISVAGQTFDATVGITGGENLKVVDKGASFEIIKSDSQKSAFLNIGDQSFTL